MQVSFPGLGIDVTVDRVAFSLFGVPIYWYGVIIAFGLIMGIVTASFAAKKLGEKSDITLDLVLVCAPVSIVFARLYYVFFKWDSYKDNLVDIFNIRSGGIAIYGAVIGAVITAYVYAKVKKKNPLLVFDIGAVGLITGQMIGRWGNFVNQEAFGSNTELPWGMTSKTVSDYLETLKQSGINVNPDIPVHPTFLYESLWSLAVLVILFVIVYKFYRYNGQIFFAYASLYGLGRFWIEGLRTDSLMIGEFRVSQLVALLSFVVFGFLYFYFCSKNRKKQ
ncbi:MAG: prolipoprotein diacylglyceryl transferase [Ruminococcaceae bacterium]|nr:prolipoprotein diacylglyceryl transferase [Oscillospiraceae bacterium]